MNRQRPALLAQRVLDASDFLPFHCSKCFHSCNWQASKCVKPSSHEFHRHRCRCRSIGSESHDLINLLFQSPASLPSRVIDFTICSPTSSSSSCSTSETDSDPMSRRSKTRARRSIEGRQFGSLCQHCSRITHISSGMAAHELRVGRRSGLRTVAATKAKSLLIYQNGRRPVNIYALDQ